MCIYIYLHVYILIYIFTYKCLYIHIIGSPVRLLQKLGNPLNGMSSFFKNTYTHRYIYVNVCIDEYMYMHIFIYSASPVQWNVLFIFYFSRFDAIFSPRKRANN